MPGNQEFDLSKLGLDRPSADLTRAMQLLLNVAGAGGDDTMDIVSVSPGTGRAAEDLISTVNGYIGLNAERATERILELYRVWPETHIIILMGYYVHGMEKLLVMKDATRKFLSDKKNDWSHQSVRKKYKKQDDLDLYAYKCRVLPERVQRLEKSFYREVGQWLSYPLDLETLEDGTWREGEADVTFGELACQLAKELPERAEEHLTAEEYVVLSELFLSYLRHEKANPVIKKSKISHDETLAKVLYVVASSVRLRDKKGADEDLPPLTAQAIQKGEPLFNLFAEYFRQLPQVLTDPEHPAHFLTMQIVSELNGFQHFEDPQLEEHLRVQPFSYKLCYGLARRDYEGTENYHDFICNLHVLAITTGPYQKWYRALLDYVIAANTSNGYDLVIQAHQVEEKIFDFPQVPSIGSDLRQVVSDLIQAEGTRQFVCTFSENVIPVKFLGLRGDIYWSYLSARCIQDESYVVNVELELIDHVENVGRVQRVTDVSKVRFQVRIDGDQVSTYLPVIDRQNVTPEIERVLIQHVNVLLTFAHRYLIEVDVEEKNPEPGQEEPLPRKKKKKLAPITPEHQLRQGKIGTREERMAQYVEEPSDEVEPEPVFNQTPRSSEMISVATAETDAVSKFLPQGIIIPEGLLEEMQSRKKGAAARIYGETLDFVTRYNEAKAMEKPGKGRQLEEVYGPDGQNVWRFKVNHDTRCVVVDIGDGHALLLSADNHDGAYDNVDRMRQMVSRGLAKYEREGK